MQKWPSQLGPVRDPSRAVPGEKSAKRMAILKSLEEDGELDIAAIVDRPAKKLKVDVPAILDDVVGDDVPLDGIIDDVVMDPGPLEDDVVGDDIAGDDVVGDDGQQVDELVLAVPPPVPVGDGLPAGLEAISYFIEGQKVTRETHILPSGVEAVGVRVHCCNINHGKCRLFRSIRLGTDRYGPRAAQYYLGAWLRIAFESGDKAGHRKPTSAEVDAYAAEDVG